MYDKYITLATDISIDSGDKVATWAAYIRYDGGAIKKSGVFKEYPPNTFQAESLALINALVIINNSISDLHDYRLIVHSEVFNPLKPIRNKNGAIKEHDKRRSDAIFSIAIPILNEFISWDIRKIKAHNRDVKPYEKGKYYMNEWCDKKARKLLRDTSRDIRNRGCNA